MTPKLNVIILSEFRMNFDMTPYSENRSNISQQPICPFHLQQSCRETEEELLEIEISKFVDLFLQASLNFNFLIYWGLRTRKSRWGQIWRIRWVGLIRPGTYQPTCYLIGKTSIRIPQLARRRFESGCQPFSRLLISSLFSHYTVHYKAGLVVQSSTFTT